MRDGKVTSLRLVLIWRTEMRGSNEGVSISQTEIG